MSTSLIFLSDGTFVVVGIPLSDLVIRLESSMKKDDPVVVALPRAEGEGLHWINPRQIVRITRA